MLFTPKYYEGLRKYMPQIEVIPHQVITKEELEVSKARRFDFPMATILCYNINENVFYFIKSHLFFF